MTDAAVDAFVKHVVYRSAYHRSVARHVNYSRDPADEPYLDLAVSVGADYLVTRDNDLLSLASDHAAFASDFRRRCRGIRIIDPAAFIRSVSAEPS